MKRINGHIDSGIDNKADNQADNRTAGRITHRNLPQRFLKGRECLMSHFRPILNHFGLTEQQWRILRALDEHAQLEPREICQLCQIQSSSMAGVLARMEETGLISRTRVAQDQRRVLVSLAPAGNQLIDDIAPLIELQYQYIETAFGQPVFDALFIAIDAFIAVQSQPVQKVALPAD